MAFSTTALALAQPSIMALATALNTGLVGTVTTGAAGTNAQVSITTGPSPSINFTIPRGSVPTINIGNVTTGAPGTPAQVTNSGTATAAILNFTIPQGSSGTGTADMSKSENLAGLANYATARSNLGLGSAAVLNTGTGAGNVPVLDANGKLVDTIIPDSLVGAVKYRGTWDANANTINPGGTALPAASGSNKGFYYKVSVAGSTNINGETDWKVGDWAISNGSTYDKIDNTDQVSSVAGLSGAITVASLKAALNLSGTNSGDQTDITGNSGTTTKLQTPRTIASTGDVTWSVTFDGSGNASGTATLANSGATAGTYTNATVTIDAKGRVTQAMSGSTSSGPTVINPSWLVKATGTGASQTVTIPYSGYMAADLRVSANGIIQNPDIDYTLSGTTLMTTQPNNAIILVWPASPAIAKQIVTTYTGSVTAGVGDAECFIRMNVASANTFTVPSNASVAFAIGTKFDVQQVGAGQTSFVAASGVTIQSDTNYLKLKGQYSAASLIKVDTNVWALVGALVA